MSSTTTSQVLTRQEISSASEWNSKVASSRPAPSYLFASPYAIVAVGRVED